MAKIDAILRQAREQGASDLHLATGSPPLVRLHGELAALPHEPLARDVVQLLLYELMDGATKAQFEEARDVEFAYELPGVARARCHVFDQCRGVSGTFRILPNTIPTAEALGLPDELVQLAECPGGLIVVCGPARSGKTSTIAALVDHVNRVRRAHVLTLEDPIEYKFTNRQSLVSQREIGRNTRGFAAGLRAALREDADVIVVGEAPDVETLALALAGASTGRLVLMSLHARTATHALDRMLDRFAGEGERQARVQLSDSLLGIAAQRLLPRADGGQALATELLIGTREVRAHVRERETDAIEEDLARGFDGMQSLDAALLGLVEAGDVAPEDAVQHLTNPEILPLPTSRARRVA